MDIFEGRRAGGFPEARGPGQAIGFGDLGNIHLIEVGPEFQQSRNPFLAAIFASVFE
ncbi:MAG TPA: hypothetical protein VIK53_14075 [Verrucomicrobiae bacterium]